MLSVLYLSTRHYLLGNAESILYLYLGAFEAAKAVSRQYKWTTIQDDKVPNTTVDSNVALPRRKRFKHTTTAALHAQQHIAIHPPSPLTPPTASSPTPQSQAATTS